MKVIFLAIVVIILIGLFGAAALFLIGTDRSQVAGEETGEVIVKSPAPRIPPLEMVIVQAGLDTSERRILTCLYDCKTLNPPLSADSTALFDGTWWYHYVEQSGKEDKVEFRRTNNFTGTSQAIITSTDLVEPRGSAISFDGSKVAFWLDNKISVKKLTELWIYDAAVGGNKLLAENLVAPDVVTRARWNKAGSIIWFLADSGKGDEQQLELVTVNAQTGEVKAVFSNLDLNSLQDEIDHDVMDINFDGSALAYVDHRGREDNLIIAEGGRQLKTIETRGTVPFVNWRGKNDLLYAVQNPSEFVFWQISDGRQLPIVRMPGVLRSATLDTSGKYAALVANTSPGAAHRYVVDLAASAAEDKGAIPAFGKYAYVVQARLSGDGNADDELSVQLTDGQVAAFVTNNLQEITGLAAAEPRRMIVTNIPGLIFLDYGLPAGDSERLLVQIKDAVHAEWSVEAKYLPAGGEWHKVRGGGSDPKPVRMYEWEAQLEQWVLKQELPINT